MKMLGEVVERRGVLEAVAGRPGQDRPGVVLLELLAHEVVVAADHDTPHGFLTTLLGGIVDREEGERQGAVPRHHPTRSFPFETSFKFFVLAERRCHRRVDPRHLLDLLRNQIFAGTSARKSICCAFL